MQKGLSAQAAFEVVSQTPALDAWIVRLDPAGSILWQRAYVGSRSEYFWTIRDLPAGDLIVSGTTDTWGAGGSDFLVMRLDAAGNVLWQKAYGGPAEDSDGFLTLAAAGAVFGGLTSSFGAGGTDGAVIRIDDTGAIIRQKALGGPLFDQVLPQVSLPDGGTLAMGSTVSFGAGDSDLWMLRFDASDNSGNACAFVSESSFVATPTTAVVIDTTAVVVPTNAALVPTSAVRTPVDVATELACFGTAMQVDADIKPGSCPNPLNLNHRGVIPAALTMLGPDDAALIDLGSVTLEGVPASRCVIADVSAPFDDTAACCGTPEPDGIPDVMCHFDSQAVGAALCARRVPPPRAGDVIDLELAASTLDGGSVRARDCARIQTFGCSTVPSLPGHLRAPTHVRR